MSPQKYQKSRNCCVVSTASGRWLCSLSNTRTGTFFQVNAITVCGVERNVSMDS